ncbi:arabinogalactan oligomer/maltooligosaccharide transport system permease protein [Croceifilum oryzae]|uniref:Arabinogalactan oligomer/maltooligosaccharide transport system permease protein n=1 Tax=Croceifilum oryzae TaxID=1553429 RepID=A0AAJ1TIS3_9BACL|nr:sugar ABC transporter permease [Croceifilum oryzae]MDQ0417302.1 arabinogalactan oligomer/maltooligosaccharide transport system permease protein [Croceifilum oryzae]
MKYKGSAWIAWIFLLPSLLTIGLVLFYPLAKEIRYSFNDHHGQFSFQHYIELFGSFFSSNSVFRDVIFQTIAWTVINLFLQFTIGLILALLLNRIRKGRAIYQTLLMIPWVVPSFVGAYAWLWLFHDRFGFMNQALHKIRLPIFHWLDNGTVTMLVVIMVNVWIGVPFMMMTFLGGLRSIPKSLYEAARMEGASPWQQLTNITLPLLRPIAATATALGMIWTFNMFNVIYIVSSGGPANSTETLVTYTYQEAFQNGNIGIASTYGVVILSFVIAFTLYYQRVWKANQNEGMY